MLLYRTQARTRSNWSYQIKLMHKDYLQFEAIRGSNEFVWVATIEPTEELNKETAWTEEMLDSLVSRDDWMDGNDRYIKAIIWREDTRIWSGELMFSSLGYESIPGIKKDEFVLVSYKLGNHLVQCRGKKDFCLRWCCFLPWQGKYMSDSKMRITYFMDFFNDIRSGKLNKYLDYSENDTAEHAAHAAKQHPPQRPTAMPDPNYPLMCLDGEGNIQILPPGSF